MKKRLLSDFQLFSSHSVIKSFISVLLVSKFSPVFAFKTFCNQNKNVVTQSRTGLQIYEGRDDQLNRPEPMA
jgi:hypothetical protein